MCVRALTKTAESSTRQSYVVEYKADKMAWKQKSIRGFQDRGPRRDKGRKPTKDQNSFFDLTANLACNLHIFADSDRETAPSAYEPACGPPCFSFIRSRQSP